MQLFQTTRPVHKKWDINFKLVCWGIAVYLYDAVPSAWKEQLAAELSSDWFAGLQTFLEREWQCQQIFPPREKIFHALELTPPEKVKVVILGQDPYHDEGQAHGLCFSVPPGIKPPPSLRNICREMADDLGTDVPAGGCLECWARQGVLLLNSVLTVRAHQAGSHKNKGWEKFSDAVIRQVNLNPEPVVFVLWGAFAQKKVLLLDLHKHFVITSPHPSPLSAHRGFSGSRPFSQINQLLVDSGRKPIDWDIPQYPVADTTAFIQQKLF